MRIVFAGTPEFAAQSLDALIAAGHDIVLVLTQPDRPAGRGMKLQPSPVKVRAAQAGIPVYQPERLRDEAAWQPIQASRADLMVVVAYGLILPQAVLDLPRLGCINVHASLLPRWRGAAPIQRAIEAGDRQTGVCIMQMEAGLDTGPVISAVTLDIDSRETAGGLHDRLAAAGAKLLCETLSQLPLPPAVKQSEEGVTYAHKISKASAQIDWHQSAAVIDRTIRAFNPFPGAFFHWGEHVVKVWEAELETSKIDGQPGTVLSATSEAIVVACGVGAIRLLTIQMPGSRRMRVADYLSGHTLQKGTLFVELDQGVKNV